MSFFGWGAAVEAAKSLPADLRISGLAPGRPQGRLNRIVVVTTESEILVVATDGSVEWRAALAGASARAAGSDSVEIRPSSGQPIKIVIGHLDRRRVIDHLQKACGHTGKPSSDGKPKSPQDGDEILGSNGRVKIVGGLIEITRDLSHDVAFGNLRGTKSIPIRAVQAVQFKKATAWVGGAIEFVVAGDRSNTGHDSMSLVNQPVLDVVLGRRIARMSNENVVTFTVKQEPAFLALHKYVLSLISDDPSSPSPPAIEQPADLVKQLEQLRQLHAGGVLTADEFGKAKARLLSER